MLSHLLCFYFLLFTESITARLLLKRDTDINPSRCPNFCAGTNSSTDPNQYVCGDPRLEPVTLPSGIPLGGIVGNDSTYHRLGGLCPGAFLSTYTSTGQFVYPPYNGFQLDTSGQPIMDNMTLSLGTNFDRFRSEYGTFMSAAGAPYAQRSLPPSNLDAAPGATYPYNYHVYTVSKPVIVVAGPIAPAFGQQGLGLQFLMPANIMTLVNQGYLSRLNLTDDPDW